MQEFPLPKLADFRRGFKATTSQAGEHSGAQQVTVKPQEKLSINP